MNDGRSQAFWDMTMMEWASGLASASGQILPEEIAGQIDRLHRARDAIIATAYAIKSRKMDSALGYQRMTSALWGRVPDVSEAPPHRA